MINIRNWVICRKSRIERLMPGYPAKDIRYPFWKQCIFTEKRVGEILREMNK